MMTGIVIVLKTAPPSDTDRYNCNRSPYEVVDGGITFMIMNYEV